MEETGRYRLRSNHEVKMTSNEINHLVDAVRIVTSVIVQSEIHCQGLIRRKACTNPNRGTSLQNGL